MPIIVAVALAIGVRRVLSDENIYTVKLVARGHFVPKALHANMFLVRHAGQVMERDVTVAAGRRGFRRVTARPANEPALQHVVVTRRNHIAGVIRVNTGLRRGVEAAYSPASDLAMSCNAASRWRARPTSCLMWYSAWRAANSSMAVVTTADGRWRPSQNRRHHLQGAHRQLGRRKYQALRVDCAARRPLSTQVGYDYRSNDQRSCG